MQLYVIQRRNDWATADDLKAAAERSATEGDKPGSGVRWIRSYVVSETSGELGTFCIYEADSPEAIRAHAAASADGRRRDRAGRRHRRRAARPRRRRSVTAQARPPHGGRAVALNP